MYSKQDPTKVIASVLSTSAASNCNTMEKQGGVKKNLQRIKGSDYVESTYATKPSLLDLIPHADEIKKIQASNKQEGTFIFCLIKI